MPLVSVICTIKNGRPFLEETLASVMNQSYNDWELLVVDDGSTDGTVGMLERYATLDHRMQVIPTPGVGRGRALNLALDKAKGKYIANIDIDDPSHPDRLGIQVQILEEFPEFVVIGTKSILINEHETPRWDNGGNDSISINDVTHKLLVRNYLNHSSVMMRSAALADVGGYSIYRRSQFDYCLWLTLAQHGYRLGVISRKLCSKRIHNSQSFERTKRLNYLTECIRLQYKFMKNSNVSCVMYSMLVLSFFYGLLPRQIRKTLWHLQ